MSIFDGMDSQKQVDMVLRHVSSLRDTFRPWTSKVVTAWNPLQHPERPGVSTLQLWRPGMADSEIKEGKRLRNQYISNFVPTGSANLVQRLTQAGVRVNIILPSEADEQVKVSGLEDVAKGIINKQEDVWAASWQPGSWLEAVAQMAVFPGKLVGVPRVSKVGDDLEIEWELWDPLKVYHDFQAGRGAKRLVHEEWMEQDAIEMLVFDLQMQGLPAAITDTLNSHFRQRRQSGNGKDKVPVFRVADYYLEEQDGDRRRVWEALAVDDIMMMMPTPREGANWKQLPVEIRSHSFMARSYVTGPDTPQYQVSAHRTEWVERHAEPWFSQLEYTIPQYQHYKTLEGDALAEQVHPVKVLKSQDGELVIQDEHWGPDATLSLRMDQFIEYLQATTPTLDKFSIIQSLERDMANAMPDVLRGGVAFPGQSGFHLFQQKQLAEMVVLPYADMMSNWLERMLLRTFATMKEMGGEISVDTQEKDNGKWFTKRFTTEQFPKHFRPKVKLSPQLPKDDFQAVQLYRQVLEGEQPGMDWMSAMERFLEVEDPVEMVNRIQELRARSHPAAVNFDAARALQARVDAAFAEAERHSGAERARRRLEARAFEIMVQPIIQSLLGGTSPRQQPQAPGIPPSVLPPELLNNPDVAATAQGRPNAAMGGRGPSRNGTQEG